MHVKRHEQSIPKIPSPAGTPAQAEVANQVPTSSVGRSVAAKAKEETRQMPRKSTRRDEARSTPSCARAALIPTITCALRVIAAAQILLLASHTAEDAAAGDAPGAPIVLFLSRAAKASLAH
jgi:hypothetical protein